MYFICWPEINLNGETWLVRIHIAAPNCCLRHSDVVVNGNMQVNNSITREIWRILWSHNDRFCSMFGADILYTYKFQLIGAAVCTIAIEVYLV